MKMVDADIFDSTRISPETKEFNLEMERTLSSFPPLYTIQPQEIRDDRDAGKGIFPVRRMEEVVTRIIPGCAENVAVRVYIPNNVKGIYLFIHGGGFMLGRAHYQDESLVRIACECEVVSISIDYRLAPENPFPAAVDDCEAVALYLVNHMQKEYGTTNLIIGGESAGANLSLVTLMRMRDKHGYTGFNAVNLLYGFFDLSLTPSARNWGESPNLILTTRLLEWFCQNYLIDGKTTHSEVSPLYGELSDLPPAIFTVGTQDPLIDDTLFTYMRWISAGNRAELAIYPGGCHAFNAFPIQIAHQANARIVEFIKKYTS